MAAPKPQKVSVGFQGGQVLSLRVAEKDISTLRQALGQGGWHEVQSDEGPVALDVSQIVYVRIESTELRVGFGA